MDSNINVATVNPTPRQFVKTNVPNLINLEPIDTHYGRCAVNGKLARQSLETSDFDIPTISRWLGHKDGGALAMNGSPSQFPPVSIGQAAELQTPCSSSRSASVSRWYCGSEL